MEEVQAVAQEKGGNIKNKRKQTNIGRIRIGYTIKATKTKEVGNATKHSEWHEGS